MAVIGKITTGNKKERGGASDDGGLFIKTLQKKNAKSYKVTSEHDDALQLELVHYNHQGSPGFEGFVNDKRIKGLETLQREEDETQDKYSASLDKKKEDPEFETKIKQLDAWYSKQKIKHLKRCAQVVEEVNAEILDVYKDECWRAPIQLVDFDDVTVGRLAWDQNKNSTFCRSLTSVGAYLKKSSFPTEAVRSEYHNDGSKTDMIVECNSRECPYASEKGKDGFVCKPVTKLKVHLDLPGSPSNGSDFTVDTKAYNSRQNIIDFCEKAEKVCGGFLSGMSMELVVKRKTMVDSSGNTRNPKLLYLRFKSTMDEVLEKATQNIERALKLQQIKTTFKESVDIFKIGGDEDEMAGDEDGLTAEESEIKTEVKPVEAPKPKVVEDNVDDFNGDEIPF